MRRVICAILVGAVLLVTAGAAPQPRFRQPVPAPRPAVPSPRFAGGHWKKQCGPNGCVDVWVPDAGKARVAPASVRVYPRGLRRFFGN